MDLRRRHPALRTGRPTPRGGGALASGSGLPGSEARRVRSSPRQQPCRGSSLAAKHRSVRRYWHLDRHLGRPGELVAAAAYRGDRLDPPPTSCRCFEASLGPAPPIARMWYQRACPTSPSYQAHAMVTRQTGFSRGQHPPRRRRPGSTLSVDEGAVDRASSPARPARDGAMSGRRPLASARTWRSRPVLPRNRFREIFPKLSDQAGLGGHLRLLDEVGPFARAGPVRPPSRGRPGHGRPPHRANFIPEPSERPAMQFIDSLRLIALDPVMQKLSEQVVAPEPLGFVVHPVQ